MRKRYDCWHLKAEERKRDLELIQKQVKKCMEEERTAEMGAGDDQYVMQKALDDLSSVSEKNDFERYHQAQYKYMLTRMKKDWIALMLRTNALTESLHSKLQIDKEESEKHRKAMEGKLQGKRRLDNLMNNIDHE